MRRLMWTVLAALVLTSGALAAEPQTPSEFCKALRASQPALFGAGKTYRNLGACVSKQNTNAETDKTSAGTTCRAESTDANFAASHGGKSFAAYYGTSGGNGNDDAKGNGNAFGKCVSQHAKQKTAARQGRELKAAKTCKAELELTPELFGAKYPGKTFATKYGTNKNAKNALGKCVSALAKTA